ncbi:electron transfer flavoprotein subunit beta/FixA family protein [Scandinavium sp. NPDC088450]|uniref:electron transfer flavoprotein subunit beta/FixA family protein n=1 Tax=Scandinavium sp. NPDC088450 TaxID=3364514 RepID=UPI00384AB6CF
MNILLAFKAEPDLAMLAEADWNAAAQGIAGPDPALMRVAMGNDEQGAAELMLLARESDPSLTLKAVTLGDTRTLPALRQLAALGFDDLTLLQAEQDLRFSPAFVAEQLANHARKTEAGLVLLGTQSSEGQNGQTGWLLAEMLGWPCLSQVSGLSSADQGFVVECEDTEQRSLWQVRKPAVLIVQNRGQLALRVPGMRAKMAAAKADIRQQTCQPLQPDLLSCKALTRSLQRREGVLIKEQTPQDSARRLWRDYLAARRLS